MNASFPGRVGLQQRVIPSYRGLFFETLAGTCRGGLSVFAGVPQAGEGIDSLDHLQFARLVRANNLALGDPGTAWFLSWQQGFLRWLTEWQPQVLIVEANPRYLATRRAISWMHRRGLKVIGWGLGAPPITGKLAGFRRWERMGFLSQLDAVIAYSSLGAQQYRAMGLPAEQVYTAVNAVEPAPRGAPLTKSTHADKRACLLFVGRLQPRKRLDLLLQACANLAPELQPELVIVGDGPARAEFQRTARQQYPGAVFAGEKHGAELESYYAAADLFVLPGTGGLAIQQAMAHGLPVIAARGDGTQDDLVRADNGWQVPPDDLAALTQALATALGARSRLEQMGEASYRIVAQEINVDKMVEVFVRALQDVSTLR